MPHNPFSSKHRHQRDGSMDDPRGPSKSSNDNKNPLDSIRSLSNKLRPHTAVANTEEEPGPSPNDVKAGTAFPIAARANKNAPNAGLRQSSGRGVVDTNEHTGSGPDSDGEPGPERRIQEQSGRTARVLEKIDKSENAPDAAGRAGGDYDGTSNPKGSGPGMLEPPGPSDTGEPSAPGSVKSGGSQRSSTAAYTPRARQGPRGGFDPSVDPGSALAGGDGDAPQERPGPVPDIVPGLHKGTEDPGLPGQKEPPGSSKKALEQASEDYPQEKIDAKLKTKREQLEDQRALQAESLGWRQIGGFDPREKLSTDESDNMLAHATMLDEYISDKYIGDWWQNASIIGITGVLSWVVGRFGYSMAPVGFILLAMGCLYRTSIRRLRRNFRDDVLRELTLNRVESDSESMEWLNSFLVKFWLIFEPSLSHMVTEIGNEVLKEQTPPFLDSVTLRKFTLGTKAPRIEFVRSFPKTDPSVVVMDYAASFTPNDVMDLTSRQLKSKVNPLVQLGVTIGKGFVKATFPILVEDMSFAGTIRARIKLNSKFPHVQSVDVSFVTPPEFDFVLKPVGGRRLGLDVMKFVPGLSKFIKETVHANLGPMVYAPNAFQINVEQLMQGVMIASGVGVLAVHISNAKELKSTTLDGSMDPYVRLLDQAKGERARTKIKSNVENPVWNQTIYTIIQNTTQHCMLEVLDFNSKHQDQSVGMCSFDIEKLIEKDNDVQKTVSIMTGGRTSGKLTYSARYAPVHIASSEDSQESGDVPRDTKTGIMYLNVIAARNLDSKHSKVAKLSTFVEVEIAGKLLESTKVSRDTNNPEYSFSKEIIVFNKTADLLCLRVFNNKAKGKEKTRVGVLRRRVQRIILENQKGNSWFTLEPEGSGEIQIQTQWKPVAIPGVEGGNYVEPVGVVRLDIFRAFDLRNLEHVGKVDPYIRVFLNGVLIGRTEFYQGTLNPVYNETMFIPVENELQTVTIECMDAERRSKDRSLGSFEIPLTNILKCDRKGKYDSFKQDEKFSSNFVMPERGPKGTLEYGLEFYPVIRVASPKEASRVREERVKIKELEARQEELSETEEDELNLRKQRLEIAGEEMPLEKQLSYPCGVVAVIIDSVKGFDLGERIRVTAENNPNPILLSAKFRSKKATVGESCDYVTSQLNISNLRIQLVDERNIEDPSVAQAELVLGARELLETAHTESATFKFGKNGEITLGARYFPLPDYKPRPEEDISTTGCIQIRLNKAVEVEGTDLNRFSDPYVSFYMNDSKERIYKSRTIKKTLNPVWEEEFRFDYMDIPTSTMKLIVYNWDMGNRDDYLGGVEIDFSEFEPLVWKTFDTQLYEVHRGNKATKRNKLRKGNLHFEARYSPGKLHLNRGEPEIGEETVTRIVGSVGFKSESIGNLGMNALKGTSGFATGIVGGAGGMVGGAGSKVLGVFGIGDDEKAEFESYAKDFSISVEQVSGLQDGTEYQVRFFTAQGREKEIFKSSVLTAGGNDNPEGEAFEHKDILGSMMGVKLVEVKSLGRRKELGQSEFNLEPGEYPVELGDGISVTVNITED